MRHRFVLVVLLSCSMLAACQSLPQPVKVDFAEPQPQAYSTPAPRTATGSLFQSGNYRPTFEDRRARNVGDTLTIQITENVTASQKSTSTANRNGAYNASDRQSLALQMQGLRDQLFNYANRLDSNGNPLFGGLASQAAPFVDAASGVSFSGIGGQRAATTTAIPGAMDGQSVWMNVPSGNGVFKVDLNPANTGAVNTDAGQVIDPTLVTGHNYNIVFTSPTTYSVSNTSTNAVVVNNQTYTSGQAIVFDGLSIVVNGKAKSGDSLQVTPSTQLNVFKVLDDAIASIRSDSGNILSHQLSLALTQIDASTNRLESARMVAGDLLNRADTIDSNQQSKTLQLEADRSRAEDLDMPQAISEFQSQQTGYDSALKTYAAVQRLSLFNYISS